MTDIIRVMATKFLPASLPTLSSRDRGRGGTKSTNQGGLVGENQCFIEKVWVRIQIPVKFLYFCCQYLLIVFLDVRNLIF